MTNHAAEAYQRVQTDAERDRILTNSYRRSATSRAAFTSGCPATCPSRISSTPA